MAPTEITRRHVIANYVEPALASGQKTIVIRVGTVLKELGWTNRTPSVFSTLSSRAFQREAGLELIEKKGGPASGGPSTTVQFVYRVLDSRAAERSHDSGSKPLPNGAGLEKLIGIFAKEYAEVGGGEAYLRAERDWGPDTWERYEREEKARRETGR